MSGRLKVLTLLLGVWMLMFGFLKFFQPIRGWFDVQFQQSHLPHQLILPGKVSEMVVGILFLLPWLRRSLTVRSKDQILLFACFILVIQMVVAIYVHLQLGVPPGVLPFGIKPPVVPVSVLLLGLLTAFDAWKQLRIERA
jgi:DoxX-like family